MDSIPLISASQLKPFTDVLEQIGCPIEQYLHQVNLPTHILETPDAIIPERPLWHLAELASQKENIEGFGFLCGENGAIEELNGIENWLRPSPTLYHALITFCDLVDDVSSDAKFWLVKRDNETLFCREGIKSIKLGRWPVEQYTLMVMLQLIRMGAGKDWQPDKVYLQTETATGFDETTVLNKAKIHIGQPYTAIAIPHSILCQPLQKTNQAKKYIHIPNNEYLLCSSNTQFIDVMRYIVSTYLHGEYPEINIIADAIGLSSRTLQRRLTRAGTTYSDLIQQVRYGKARSLLKEDDIKLLDIAYELGYSDPAHFSRAFHRMAGVCPREFRNLQTERQT